ncbi:sulfur controller 2 [Truncatella angustata]|uniref:Sulfur controller 2 n=1 Tax=Truncatella angustata TaxID=152316 RepID=A0A9P8ZXH6_9PEZI|nr:sulfur controller 2 [Truncatella angustata]KAH6654004.1 sulfur controller 2 [Truncatella angustata]
MSQQLLGQSVTPFLREHIPGLYAPIGKPDFPATINNSDNTKDPNSKFCYRHRPDSKCRRAADESKMGAIQSALERLPQADQQAITHVWSLFSAAPAKHRELMLQGVITQCCFPQLSMVSREISESLKIDFLGALPTEVSLKILRFLDCVSLCKASQVSHRWRTLADDDLVWQHLCMQHIERKCTACGWALPRLENKRMKDWKKQHQLAIAKIRQAEVVEIQDTDTTANEVAVALVSRKRDASGLDDSEASRVKRQCSEGAQRNSMERQLRPWKDVYRDRYKIGYNWKHGRCSIKVFRNQHTNGITCLQFSEDMLATGSYDSTIKLWNIEKTEVIRTLVGHTMGIRAIQFDDRVLVSGALDGTVKIWNWRTGQCLNTLTHSGGVITVHMDGPYLASGSMDRSIKVFNFKTQQIICLRGHGDWVNQVRIDVASRTLLSASDDCTVKLWDLDTQRCIRTYEGHVGQVQQVMALPDDFEFEEEDGHEADNASVASGRSSTPGACSSGALPSPPADEERSAYGSVFAEDTSRQLPPRYFLTGSLDATLRLWDTASGRCLKTHFGHVEGIWALQVDQLRYVTGANDATVKLWDPRTGRCERTFTGHEGPVTCVGLSDSRLASGGEDGEVRLYRFDCDPSEAAAWGTPA